MADKLQGGVKAGSTSLSIPAMLRSTTDNTGVTGKVYTDVTASYWRQGGTRTAITTATLVAVDSAYSSGGFKEVDATNMPGAYRFDVPDAAIATGADWVIISLKVAGAYLFIQLFELTTNVVQSTDNATNISAIKTKTDFLPSATAGAAGGVFIAGSNAATSVTTALTANITGNLSGSVGSVTGAVGSVTGAVGSVTAGVTLASGTHTGAVIPTVTDVTNKTGYALSAAGVNAILDETSTGLIGVPNTLRGLIWFVRQFVKNKLKYDKALDQMILYEDDGLTAKLTHAMTDNANEATRGAGS